MIISQYSFLHIDATHYLISPNECQKSDLYNTCQVNEFIAGVGTDAPDVEEENVFSRPSVGYDDMWAKTLLETNEMEV